MLEYIPFIVCRIKVKSLESQNAREIYCHNVVTQDITPWIVVRHRSFAFQQANLSFCKDLSEL